MRIVAGQFRFMHQRRPGAAVAGHRPPVRRGSRTGHRYEPARDRGTRGAGASGGVAAVATPTTAASAAAGLSRDRRGREPQR